MGWMTKCDAEAHHHAFKAYEYCLFRFMCWNRPNMDAAFQNGPLPSLRPSWGRVMEASMRVHR